MTDSVGDTHPLIAFAQTEFGMHLTALLLVGYSAEVVTASRALVITLPNEQHYLQLIADEQRHSAARLPSAQEPLVLLVLLKLLTESGTHSAQVTYQPETILRLLGWSLSTASEARLEQALLRYFRLSYEPVSSMAELTGEEPVEFIRQMRLISEYGRTEETEADGAGFRFVESYVKFNPTFIQHLSSRKLFGIDWDDVQMLEEIS